jgi:hypothetical protein
VTVSTDEKGVSQYYPGSVYWNTNFRSVTIHRMIHPSQHLDAHMNWRASPWGAR